MYQATAAAFIPLPIIETRLAANTKRSARFSKIERITYFSNARSLTKEASPRKGEPRVRGGLWRKKSIAQAKQLFQPTPEPLARDLLVLVPKPKKIQPLSPRAAAGVRDGSSLSNGHGCQHSKKYSG